MNGFFYTSVVLRRNECGCLHVHGAAVLGTDLFTWDTAPFADGAVLRGLWVAGLFHPLLCSFCGFTALFPKGTVLLQLLFACLFQGVTLFCVFPVVDRQCLVLARQCRKKKACGILSGPSSNAFLLSYTLPGFYPLHTMIPSWLLSPFFSEPHRIDQPVAYCPACLPVLSSSLIFLPTSSLPLSYPASIFIGSSPGFLVFREVPTLLNFINLFPTSLPVDFNPLTHWRLLSPC